MAQVSVNDLKDFHGASRVMSLEFLDAHDNHLRTLEGLGFAPNLRWLNVRNSDLVSLAGLRNIPNLVVLDSSRNLLETAAGVECCPHLLEVNLSVNNLNDLHRIARLRDLRVLDLTSNYLAEVPGGLTQLHTLSLAHNNFESHHVDAVVGALSEMRALRMLYVGRNDFTRNDVQRIRGAVEARGCRVDESHRGVPDDDHGTGSGSCSGSGCVLA